MREGCLICGEPLEYLAEEIPMECSICHKTKNSRARCVRGHYVCDECHMKGLDAILGVCMEETSKDPAAILMRMMDLPFCHMHGPEHHVMTGAALLTAYRNAGGEIDLPSALGEMIARGRSVPGGVCGAWGACGAAISAGIFAAIAMGSTPLTEEPFALANGMTARALGRIAETGGPRCCKRDSFLSVLEAVDHARERLGVEMERPEIVCRYTARNRDCIGKRCPFSPARAGGERKE